MAINSRICPRFFTFNLMTTAAFSRNTGKLFSELKLVTDNSPVDNVLLRSKVYQQIGLSLAAVQLVDKIDSFVHVFSSPHERYMLQQAVRFSCRGTPLSNRPSVHSQLVPTTLKTANNSGVIGDPAPPRIWHPRVKSPRDFGPPSVFLLSPTEQGIRYPHAKFPREFGIPM